MSGATSVALARWLGSSGIRLVRVVGEGKKQKEVRVSMSDASGFIAVTFEAQKDKQL